jgi:hypothetical protein
MPPDNTSAFDDKHPFVLPHVKDGMDREHDVYLVARGGSVILYSPKRYWSIEITPDQADTLAPAIQGAGDRARKQKPQPSS